ncbi:unnamed protein product, partial [Ectocarpus sp. 12 AP-2014]
PNPGQDLIHIPSFSWQYLGRNMRALMERLCWILAAMTVGLHEAIARLQPRNAATATDHPTPPPSKATRDVRITVGFMMERWGNRSPHRLIQGVLERMDRSRFRLVVFSRDYTGYYCEDGKALLEAAEEVKTFPWHPFAEGLTDPFADRGVIASVHAQVPHYAALGNTLWSQLLALGRLAPAQIVFGHGHPVSSGSPAIDYFVSSDLFETTASIDARELRRIAGTPSDLSLATAVTTDAGAEGCDDDDSVHSPTAGGRGGEGEQDYAEPLVFFYSLTASLSEVFGPANAPLVRPRAEISLVEGDHLYHCIQNSKKIHTDFDQVMKGVLQRDPAAKILLTAGSEVHLPRWGRTLGSDLVERLVFLPHLDHAEMLLVVANCKVILDTFFGGGGGDLAGGVVGRGPSGYAARSDIRGRVGRRQGASGVRCRRHGEEGRQAGHGLNAHRQSLRCEARTEKPVIRPHRATREWEQFLERAVQSAVSPDAKI